MTLIALWFTTFGVGVLGSLIPFVNVEIYLVPAVALSPRSFILPLVIAAAAGQTVGKIAMYFVGSGVLKMRSGRVQRGLEAAQARMEARPVWGKLLFFISSVTGVPPLYVMALAAGAVRMNFPFFIVACAVGRLIHFGVVAMVPDLWQRLFG
jgi:membrane protein YqaA with SNARE-associated domain